jgi:two-component system, chemotaxis family, chemotaxis protein CheY
VPPARDLSALCVLIADDSVFMRRVLRSMLQGLGVRRIVEAEDGAVALETLETHAPDVVLLDWLMPVIDGREFLRLVRQPRHRAAYVPVIVVSGYTDRKHVSTARDAGANAVLAKPLSAASLYRAIVREVAEPRPFVRTATYFGPAWDANGKVPPNGVQETTNVD